MKNPSPQIRILVSWLFGQVNMHSTLDFYLRPARMETNVTLHKRSYELTALIYVYTVGLGMLLPLFKKWYVLASSFTNRKISTYANESASECSDKKKSFV